MVPGVCERVCWGIHALIGRGEMKEDVSLSSGDFGWGCQCLSLGRNCPQRVGSHLV